MSWLDFFRPAPTEVPVEPVVAVATLTDEDSATCQVVKIKYLDGSVREFHECRQDLVPLSLDGVRAVIRSTHSI
jgi:hypothetical protein